VSAEPPLHREEAVAAIWILTDILYEVQQIRESLEEDGEEEEDREE
jgi:hypothetical protein